MELEIKSSNRIHEMNANEWDSFVDSFFMKSATLEKFENLALTNEPHYIEVRKNNQIVGIAVTYIQREKSLYSNLEESIFNKIPKPVKKIFCLNPSLVCVCPYSPFIKNFKIDPKYEEDVLESIFKEMEKISKDNKLNSFAIIGASKDEMQYNFPNLIPFFNGYGVRFKVIWDTYESYIQPFSRKRREFLRKEWRQFENSDFKFNYDKDKETLKKVKELINKNLEKYSNDSRKDLFNEYLDCIWDFDTIKSLSIQDKHKIKACLVYANEENRIVSNLIGQTEDNPAFSFFSLSCHLPLKSAIENKQESIEMGTGAYYYKLFRGAKYEDRFALVKPISKIKYIILKPIIVKLSARNRKKHNKRLGRFYGEARGD